MELKSGDEYDHDVDHNQIGVDFNALPEGCISEILSLTTPPDACRFASISPVFRLAADSDAVWNRFLPSDYQTIIRRSVSFNPAVFSRKKDLFLDLCHHPILIDDGTKSFSLDKWSGNKCFMLSARDLTVIWGNTPQYWTWTSLLDQSRFAEVAELKLVCWLEIRGSINICMLSPATNYTAYLVFKMTTKANGFKYIPLEVSVEIAEGESLTRTVCLDIPASKQHQRHGINWVLPRQHVSEVLPCPKVRRDGWWEIELGEFYNEGGEDGELKMSVMEIKKLNGKGGLIIEGIEVRPTRVSDHSC